ncbi:hypothetical protein KIL84_004317 [Mauremys mutica]|uniref:Uncharacterized protein n=1 Tax=Mauremys mutica TaxID=74926 RepID=A0A9D3XPH2_9SAUR|nr:hypothetical protein KIL84_004317 [Mauremys mutica]
MLLINPQPGSKRPLPAPSQYASLGTRLTGKYPVLREGDKLQELGRGWTLLTADKDRKGGKDRARDREGGSLAVRPRVKLAKSPTKHSGSKENPTQHQIKDRGPP